MDAISRDYSPEILIERMSDEKLVRLLFLAFLLTRDAHDTRDTISNILPFSSSFYHLQTELASSAESPIARLSPQILSRIASHMELVCPIWPLSPIL